ncbi:hypothetical protein LOTGIDRAFT_236859 [Lottia gigantea]|uniref:Proteasome assembly chaperone 4 n=1 Tax=Lottia gigantea TaxID=225164 RepID=V3YY83_LOTGI|nr:hypothetical protein LOTGIDRAFT_236859 [Lottia gigantea]ESO83088.1 hypothetical protein LOTGIDRAFT_236859 [Lottia gigantea]
MDVKPCSPSINIHTFSEKISDINVHFQIIQLKDSFCMWIGTGGEMGNMSLAMPGVKGSASQNPSTINIIGDSSNTVCSMLAQKLAKKCGKQVFVSSSLSFDQFLTPLVEKRVFEEWKQHPEIF